MSNTATKENANNKVEGAQKETPKAPITSTVETPKEKTEKVTPGQITAALRSQMKEKKGETYLSVTYARYLFESMSIDELRAITNAIEEFQSAKREAEIKHLEARLAILKGKA